MTIFALAWRSALARRRLFVWNIGVPLLLLTPVAMSDAAAPHRTAVFGVFIVFFATFGSAIPTVRDGRSGWLDVVFQTGYSRRRWMIETVLAGAALDLLQLGPVLTVLLLASGNPSLRGTGALFLALLLSLITANVIGVLLAAAVRSLAESALVSAATSLLLLHFAGFFRTPATGWSATVAEFVPYTPLRIALDYAQGGPVSWPQDWVGALAVGGICAAGGVIWVGSWARRFEWPHVG